MSAFTQLAAATAGAALECEAGKSAGAVKSQDMTPCLLPILV